MKHWNSNWGEQLKRESSWCSIWKSNWSEYLKRTAEVNEQLLERESTCWCERVFVDENEQLLMRANSWRERTVGAAFETVSEASIWSKRLKWASSCWSKRSIVEASDQSLKWASSCWSERLVVEANDQLLKRVSSCWSAQAVVEASEQLLMRHLKQHLKRLFEANTWSERAVVEANDQLLKRTNDQLLKRASSWCGIWNVNWSEHLHRAKAPKIEHKNYCGAIKLIFERCTAVKYVTEQQKL